MKVGFLRRQGYNSLMDWLQNPDHVYIGRRNAYVDGADESIWANRFKVDEFGREGCIQRFKEWLLKNKQLMSQLHTLKGKTLGCWCAP